MHSEIIFRQRNYLIYIEQFNIVFLKMLIFLLVLFYLINRA